VASVVTTSQAPRAAPGASPVARLSIPIHWFIIFVDRLFTFFNRKIQDASVWTKSGGVVGSFAVVTPKVFSILTSCCHPITNRDVFLVSEERDPGFKGTGVSSRRICVDSVDSDLFPAYLDVEAIDSEVVEDKFGGFL
jgi:hypothetical protein